ncbi:MAG: hypothetical protein WCY11_12890 [Novosphingobium sp.]
MIRFLLTLLAFVSGLAAMGPSAEARVCGLGGTEIGSVDTAAAAERIALRQQGIAAPQARNAQVRQQADCARPHQRLVYIPTVQFGPDRARE